jgi:predicted alpha-1,2-mannosidase
VYTTHSLWDTFRAANPLLTLTQPYRIADIVNSYLLFYDQNGLLPIWDLHFNETSTMTGYHAVPVIADAILKDIPGFDVAKAYEAMKKSSMQNIRGTDHYRNYGYLPHDKHVENVTITLEYAFDDWCIAAVAKKLGKQEDVEYYFQRAGFYKNLFDKETGFFRPKLSDGKWVTPFDPLKSEFQVNPYTEGNAWQHTFFVPHDINGLSTLYGGNDALLAKLDTLFTMDSKLTGTPVPDISGLIGQYAHGNEPSHHIAYMYSFLGAPQKTADRVHQIMTELYDDTPEGLSGNEDCGQMSAWYVFSALGFYPCNPASGEYVIGSPMVDEATIQAADGKSFQIKVKNNSVKNKYVKAVTLNGKNHTNVYITHHDIMKGGILEIEMTNAPNNHWGKEETSMPYSLSSKK